MKTKIEQFCQQWVILPYESGRLQQIEDWIIETGIDIDYAGATVDPNTFETVQKWFVGNEEDRTIFLLKWSNT